MLGVLGALPALFSATAAQAQTAPLASWNDGPAKQAILDFQQGSSLNASNIDYDSIQAMQAMQRLKAQESLSPPNNCPGGL